MSDSTTSAKDRIFQSVGPYVLINGTVIANNFADLIDGSLEFPIVLDDAGNEQPDGGVASARVWTGTDASGEAKTFFWL